MKAASKGKAYVKLNGRHLHRQIAERKLGRKLLPGEIAHHVDRNKLNNLDDNIDVLPSQSEHAKAHVREMLEARKKKHGY